LGPQPIGAPSQGRARQTHGLEELSARQLPCIIQRRHVNYYRPAGHPDCNPAERFEPSPPIKNAEPFVNKDDVLLEKAAGVIETRKRTGPDGLGRRIEKVDRVNATTVRYDYDNQHRVLAEYDGADDAQRDFVYGNFLLKIDEALLMHSNVNIGGNSTTGDYYYAHDHLYSVRALLDAVCLTVDRTGCPAGI